VEALLLVEVFGSAWESAGELGLAEGAALEDGPDEEGEIAEAGPAEVGEGGVDEAQEVRVPFFHHR